jgi:hypothetical protein
MNSLDNILKKYSYEYSQFQAGEDLSDFPEFYQDLFEYYCATGEMPYGTMKARTGDPFNWISDRLDALDYSGASH